MSLWSNIVDPARATDWSFAGVQGQSASNPIPSASWTQSGATITAYNGTAGTINTALANASNNQYVLLGAGTFNLTTQIDFAKRSNVVLRGSGANSTFIVFSAALAGVSGIINSGATDVGSFTSWSAGYSQGSNQVTVGSVSGVSANTTMVYLDQCETGLSGDTCSTGTETDPGGLYVCTALYAAGSPATGCSSDGTGGHYTALRYQLEIAMVTGVSGSVLTISAPLKYPQWSSGNTPHASYATPFQYVGIENLSVDMTAAGATNSKACIDWLNGANSWIYGSRVSNCPDHGVAWRHVVHSTIANNYISYSNTSGANHCISKDTVGNLLIQNNICQGFSPAIHTEGPDCGSVIAYNLVTNPLSPSDAIGASFQEHSGGTAFNLWEGNVLGLYFMDITHGTEPFQTVYRSLHLGWDSCANGQCGASSAKDFLTNPLYLSAYSRMVNVVGNLFGTATYHNAYQTTTSSQNKTVFVLGAGNNSVANVPDDTVVSTTTMRWGNYDVVTGAVRFCGNSSDTGWATTCSSTSEVPVSGPGYPNAVPSLGDTVAGQGVMPPSFYMPSRPPWFGATPFPAIGPDISSGNLGVCSGTINTAGHFSGMPAITSAQCTGTSLTTGWGGHANAIPAVNCFLNIMGGVPDGTGSTLAFDNNACYSSSVSLLVRV